ncbi:MAG: response regulator, partial [Deltaproteobacteria bacterium]|nr:response regulator [Deltaproteobacteria bacterium]
MSAPRVVVIAHDDWILRLLQDGLRDGGFVVTPASSADEGLAKVRELVPDCVLCDIALPGKDGYGFAAELRSEGPPLSLVPIALLSSEDDLSARTTAFDAGADALLTKPFRLDEVIAQLNALVALARRMRAQRNSLMDSLRAGPPSAPESASFRGDLEHMSLASLLTLLELERKTGTVGVRAGKHVVKIELADGHVASATLDGADIAPLDVLRDALAWDKGRITFRAKPAALRPVAARPIRVLLAEARGDVAVAPVPGVVGPSLARPAAFPPPPGRRRSANEPPPKAPAPPEPKPAARVIAKPAPGPAPAA